MTRTSEPRHFSERQWPSITFFLALLLLIPAVIILLTPFSIQGGVITGVVLYVAIATLFVVASRTIEIRGDRLIAGRASIALEHLGAMQSLDSHELKLALGRRLDARAFLATSGWIQKGVRIEITDDSDPTPYWVIGTREPERLVETVKMLQQQSGQTTAE